MDTLRLRVPIRRGQPGASRSNHHGASQLVRRNSPSGTPQARSHWQRSNYENSPAHSLHNPYALTPSPSQADSPQLSRYRALLQRYRHPLRHPSPAERAIWEAAQQELWALAQAITATTAPDVQHKVDHARRDIMALVSKQLDDCRSMDVVGSTVGSTPRPRPLSWADIEITPEFVNDPCITGITIPRTLIVRLRKALREQKRIMGGIA